MKSQRIVNIVIFAALIGLCVAGRLLPHSANFTPVAAAGLFAGFFFRSRLAALAVPMLGMLLSDAVIGGYEWPMMLAVYGAFASCVLLGRLLKPRLTALRAAGLGLGGAVVFFLGSNLATWFVYYERSVEGLLVCYTAALPFFRTKLAGDMTWTAIIFGCYVLATQAAGHLAARRKTLRPLPLV
ncbi:MAG: DUF6580 family putative transport protein [Phycisphaerae bacterium]